MAGAGEEASCPCLCKGGDLDANPPSGQHAILRDEMRLPTWFLMSPRCLRGLWASLAGGCTGWRPPAVRTFRQEGCSWRKRKQIHASWVVSGGIWRPGSPHLAPNIRKGSAPVLHKDESELTVDAACPSSAPRPLSSQMGHWEVGHGCPCPGARPLQVLSKAAILTEFMLQP